jgi:fatty acid desaturase
MRAADLFSRDEIRALTRGSDLRGALSVATDWGLVAGALALVGAAPNVLTVGVALVVIGGRQLGLAVLAHECAHRSLFRTRWLNDLVGRWLCGAPVWLDLHRYRVHHRDHHAHTGGPGDPDLGLVHPFPTTRSSLARKLARDLLGLTAARRVVGLLAMDLGLLSYTASTDARRLPFPGVGAVARLAARNLGPVVLTNAALLGLLTAAGHPALYLVWVGAWCTTYSLVLRVRSIAEHACTEPTANPLRSTRTTAASWPVRLVLAPHHVNFHLEHHLLPTVPHWRLPEVQARLEARGVLGPHNHAPGYLAVLRQVTVR